MLPVTKRRGLTVREVNRLLDWPVDDLRTLLREGLFGGYKRAGRWFVPKARLVEEQPMVVRSVRAIDRWFQEGSR